MTPKLGTIPSTGPRLDEFFVEGRMYVHERSTPCPVCRKKIEAGEDISFLHGEWAHASCATNSLVESGARSAWLALGSDLARHPRTYRASETRLIVNQLLRLAAGMPPADVDFEDEA